MSVFCKNIAVIKTLRQGFSANGGELSGIVKCEKYATRLKVEISYINFAPLDEGRYVCALSDGKETVLVEDGAFEGESKINTANGFCAMICFVHNGVLPVACAVCGQFSKYLSALPKKIAESENVLGEKKVKESKKSQQIYDDEAIAEDDYFEYDETDKMRKPLYKDKKEEKSGEKTCKNEKDNGALQKGKNKGGRGEPLSGAEEGLPRSSGDILGGNVVFSTGKSFIEEVKEEVERVLSSFPKEPTLCSVVQNSKWVKINYGDNKHYVFGAIYTDGKIEYLCYGVPATSSKVPPKSLKDLATFIPAERDKITEKGYWVAYQSALTGASVKITQT